MITAKTLNEKLEHGREMTMEEKVQLYQQVLVMEEHDPDGNPTYSIQIHIPENNIEKYRNEIYDKVHDYILLVQEHLIDPALVEHTCQTQESLDLFATGELHIKCYGEYVATLPSFSRQLN